MSEAKIFLVGTQKGKLIAMPEHGYPKEAELQELLEQYPDLLPGDQIDPENPRRWLLVARELGVPGAEGESGRWSLDHLFLDQDGRPTFVECKRAADTRARREVVAQMLDYAANGLEYWSLDRLRLAAAATAEKAGETLDERVLALLGVEAEVEDGAEAEPGSEFDAVAAIDAFWSSVEANLRNGKVRLIFVTDSTPRELRRLIEFLNDKLRDVEVLGVEVKRFQGGEHTALVPRVVGVTEAARASKAATGGVPVGHTTRTEFLSRCNPAAGEFFARLLDKAAERGHTLYWGSSGFSVRFMHPSTGKLATFCYGYPPGRFEFTVQWLPLSADEVNDLRQQLIGRGLRRASGKYTLSVHLSETNLAAMNSLFDELLDVIDRITNGH